MAFTVDGRQAITISRDDAVVAPLACLKDVEVSSFEQALGEYEEQDGATVNYVFLCDVAIEDFDPDMSHRDVALTFLAGRVEAQAGRGIDEEALPFDGPKLLGPLLDRHDAALEGSYRDDQGGHLFEVFLLSLRGEGRTVGELFALGVEAQALLDAARADGELGASTARDLVAAGQASVMLGQPESRWLDAKREPHALSGDAAKWEFAKDVAAFANTGRDALIVYGIETRREHSGDVLGTLRPFELTSFDVAAARQVLRERLSSPTSTSASSRPGPATATGGSTFPHSRPKRGRSWSAACCKATG